MYQSKKIIQIVARGLNGEIGADNKLLWNIPEDLQFFKESTLGQAVLMGRNTYENLPKMLSRRILLEVTSKWNKLYGGSLSQREILIENINVAVSHSNLLNTDCLFIAGGAKLYNSTFNIADELWITQVDKEYPEADTHYHIPEGFKMIEERDGVCCDEAGVGYSFQKWARV